jgi:ureidoacrylate peracid hydrolase
MNLRLNFRHLAATGLQLLGLVLMPISFALAQAVQVPPPPSSIKAEETALILIDFQGNFVDPEGTWYPKFQPEFERTKMLERTVALVNEARAKGVWIIHATEGYSQDYKELDPTNPGGFHRNQLLRNAWKIGSKEAAYYKPLVPRPEYKDLVLPPRIQVSAFGGTGLNEILRSKGIRNVAVAGFTTDVCNYATALSAYDLGYHVYTLREAMISFFPQIGDGLLNNIYPFWSTVIDNDPWLKMVVKK